MAMQADWKPTLLGGLLGALLPPITAGLILIGAVGLKVDSRSFLSAHFLIVLQFLLRRAARPARSKRSMEQVQKYGAQCVLAGLTLVLLVLGTGVVNGRGFSWESPAWQAYVAAIAYWIAFGSIVWLLAIPLRRQDS